MYAPSPGHGAVIDALTDDRYAATPFDSVRWGSAAAVTSAAPVTLVASVRRHMSASSVDELAPADRRRVA